MIKFRIEAIRRRKSIKDFGRARAEVEKALAEIPENWKKMLAGNITIVLFDGNITSIQDSEVQKRIVEKPRNLSGKVLGGLIATDSWNKTHALYLASLKKVYLKIDYIGTGYWFKMDLLSAVATVIWEDNEAFFFELCYPAFVKHLNLNGWIASWEDIQRTNPNTEEEKLREFHERVKKDATRRLFNRVVSLFWYNKTCLEEKWYSIAPFMKELNQRLQQAAA